jgi:hypothetical protein
MFGSSKYEKSNHFPYSQIVFCLSGLSSASLTLSQHQLFLRGEVVILTPQPPTWTRVSLFVWLITFELSGMAGPTRSYGAAGRTFRILGPAKPHLYITIRIPSRESL